MYLEPDKGAYDDTGLNGLEVKCRGPGLHGTSIQKIQQTSEYPESTWTSWSGSCPAGTAVCALKTRVEQEYIGDDAAVTGLKFFCCQY